MSEDIRKLIDKMKNWKQFLNENINNDIFYHNSDYDFNEFIKQKKNNKLKEGYLFFSNDRNTFIDRKYTYTVKLTFNSNKIFNNFDFINKFGLEYTLDAHKYEVKKMFTENIDYFYNEWVKAGVDSPDEVIEYFVRKGGNEQDKVELLFYFLTKWNDSWVILETDIFLNFIESKGFSGFVTIEEGILNLALKDDFKAVIINKENMWDD